MFRYVTILQLLPRNMTLSGFMDSVMELVRFVGRLATVGLQLEGCHSLLLSFILDFYETVIKPDEASTFR